MEEQSLMQRIPTRIIGVELYRDVAQTRPDGSRLIQRPQQVLASYPFEETIEAPRGFTSELSYTRHLKVKRTFHCTEGELFVSAADVRLGSPTFGHWQAFYLRCDDHRTLFIPAGVACGWQITSNVGCVQQCSDRASSHEDWRWLPWNDLELAIEWPEIPKQLAHHGRRSRSLATLPDRRLPKYTSSASKKALHPTERRVSSRISEAAKPGPPPPTSHTPRSLTTPAASYNEERILVIGSSGQLGRDLCRHLAKQGTIIGACRRPERGSLLPIPVQIDVSRPASIRQAIRRVKPTLIVNAAAMTDLEKSELQPRLAQMVNATAPIVIAEEAKQIGASIVHFCTNMVFGRNVSGENAERPWRETDTPNPINQYGRTKLLGTEAIRKSGVPHLILRAGWLYSGTGNNFVTKLVDLLTYRNSIGLAKDEYGTPTNTDWLAEMTTEILSRSSGNLGAWLRKNGGVFHVAPLGYASRLEVGDQIVATCRAHALPIVSSSLKPVPLRSIPSRASQPTNARLDCSKLALRFEISLPRWQQELVASVSDLLSTHQPATRSVA
jgi:dTDP-4-dehydrorhamnose reductase